MHGGWSATRVQQRFGVVSVCAYSFSPHASKWTFPQVFHMTPVLFHSVEFSSVSGLPDRKQTCKPAKPISEHAFVWLLRRVEDTSKFCRFCFGQTCKTCAKPAKLMCCHLFSSSWQIQETRLAPILVAVAALDWRVLCSCGCVPRGCENQLPPCVWQHAPLPRVGRGSAAILLSS
jgi:hypothetical protein